MKMTYRMYAIEEELAELSYLSGNIETPHVLQGESYVEVSYEANKSI